MGCMEGWEPESGKRGQGLAGSGEQTRELACLPRAIPEGSILPFLGASQELCEASAVLSSS